MTLDKTFKSFAKINIGLSIPFKYSNNYHHIVSIFEPVDIYDEIKIKINPTQKESFEIHWENLLPDFFPLDRSVFSDNFQKNLIYKAFLWMKDFLNTEKIQFPKISLRVDIKKSIPSPGGLGGGSSNAAAILLAILEYIKPGISHEKFKKILANLRSKSIEIGADVPFFIDSKGSLISGVGEIHKVYEPLHITGILAIPAFGFSTPEMYSALNKYQVDIKSKSFEDLHGQLPKNSLQHDNLSGINLKKVYADFDNLHRFLLKSNFRDIDDKEIATFKGLITRENNSTLFVKNEFYGVIKKLYPGKFLILEKIRKAACEALQNLPETESNNIVITSLTGSGSAVYAALANTNKLKPDFNEDLLERIEALKDKYPNIIWLKFCSLK
jgi:4-diphosphocytidyl-2-C-methyl-D-erythritol kinase